MNYKIRNMTRIGILLALTLGLQLMSLPQLITGVGINAMLLIAAMTVGTVPAVIIGCITPLVALMVGIMQPVLMPVVPFIMIANTILVVVFGNIQKKNKYEAVLIAAFLKFAALWLAVKFILVNILPAKMMSTVAVVFGITQFFTAMGGGALALASIPVIKNYLDKNGDAKA